MNADTETREVTFSVYPDSEGIFAVLDDEDPSLPMGVVRQAQLEAEKHYTVDDDLPAESVGTIEYRPDREEGLLVDVRIDD